MIKLLIKKFIKNYDDTTNLKVREQYGVLGGVLGIVCNILLFLLKIIIGVVMSSAAIISDAFNNLSDTLSSFISLISAKLSSKKADKDHPYGHGRIEYICSFIVSFIIIFVGFELLISAGKSLFNGLFNHEYELLTFQLVPILILSCSLLVKLWMFSYNRYLSKKINSSVLEAASKDSLSDILTSSVIIISTVLGSLLLKDNAYILDNILSIIVAVIICINGIKLVLETSDELLGKPASKEEIKEIDDYLLADPIVLGTHDLMIHNYGPGRVFATVHCEVDQSIDFVFAHEQIDKLESKVFSDLKILLTIHMDPVDSTSPEILKIKAILKDVLNSMKEKDDLSFHDLRITPGEKNINVIFDLIVPYEYTNEKSALLIKTIKESIKKENPIYNLVIKVEHNY